MRDRDLSLRIHVWKMQNVPSVIKSGLDFSASGALVDVRHNAKRLVKFLAMISATVPEMNLN